VKGASKEGKRIENTVAVEFCSTEGKGLKRIRPRATEKGMVLYTTEEGGNSVRGKVSEEKSEWLHLSSEKKQKQHWYRGDYK